MLYPVEDTLDVVALFIKSAGETVPPPAVGVVSQAMGQGQLDWKATSVGEGMNLGGQSTGTTAHTVNSVTFYVRGMLMNARHGSVNRMNPYYWVHDLVIRPVPRCRFTGFPT